MLATHYLLDNNRHAIIARLSGARSLGKGTGSGKPGGGVYKLYGIDELAQPQVKIFMIIRQHIGAVQAGIGFKLGIFKQAG